MSEQAIRTAKAITHEETEKYANLFFAGWMPEPHTIAPGAVGEYLRRAYQAGYTTGHGNGVEKLRAALVDELKAG